jgi:hypothetical protein
MDLLSGSEFHVTTCSENRAPLTLLRKVYRATWHATYYLVYFRRRMPLSARALAGSRRLCRIHCTIQPALWQPDGEPHHAGEGALAMGIPRPSRLNLRVHRTSGQAWPLRSGECLFTKRKTKAHASTTLMSIAISRLEAERKSFRRDHPHVCSPSHGLSWFASVSQVQIPADVGTRHTGRVAASSGCESI